MAKAELTIAGKRYSLGCAPGQEIRLEELGRRFDKRVTELQEALGDIGPERLFLAAGLSLMDELEAAAQATSSAPASSPATAADAREVEQRIAGLERRAAAALAEAAARIEALSARVDGGE